MYSFHIRLSGVDVLPCVLCRLPVWPWHFLVMSRKMCQLAKLALVKKYVAVSGDALLLEKEQLMIRARSYTLRAERLYL